MITPLGYAGEDLVYGLIDPDLVKEDSTGVIQAPVSEIHIVDGQLNDVKSYSKIRRLRDAPDNQRGQYFHETCQSCFKW